MPDIICKHCDHVFDDSQNYCPHCRTPTPAQQERLAAGSKKRFLYAFIGLIVFATLMILILPRDA
ncbi:hypothetical protein [Thiohalophilus thiocyanatoxydans]|uniref:Zinc ribbon protein n=1 Tax=Thiohalophilus thiocyanatoxydans TaxID=381308 RepID=A0A4R8IQB0_9GAMM|nr:hypothetical protein [Thiohalophilus thiocyanatoxydans]TDX99648.1 hypothetical protein EDC23_2434 [Thiohalophilus thiocyanatoxydans]